jgi:hypothetical protein
MPFSLTRDITIKQQLGPYNTFAEMQSAVALETPGTVCIRPDAKGFPKQTLKSGEVHDSAGHITGEWREE